MIAIEYVRSIVIDAGGTIVEFKACEFKGKPRYMAFVPDDFPMMYVQSAGYTSHGQVKEATPETLTVPRLGRDAAYTLPETLAHALLRGWTLEDLWGAGKGCAWGEDGGRGTCGLTVLEAALASPPPGWTPGQVERPWTMAGWLPPKQTWKAPEVVASPVSDLAGLAARESAPAPVLYRIEPEEIVEILPGEVTDQAVFERAVADGSLAEVIAEMKEHGVDVIEEIPSPDAPEMDTLEAPTPEAPAPEVVKSAIPDGWTELEWDKMVEAAAEAKIVETPSTGRLEYIWKNNVAKDKRRKMPALTQKNIARLVQIVAEI